MARTQKEEEYLARRNQILDVAQRLVYTKGYEQMAIQDILNDLRISKGAFYHYFNSKAAVLEALVERMAVEQVKPLLAAVVHDPALSAVEKLNRYFETAGNWKMTQKTVMLALARVWMADENAVVRQKLTMVMVKQVVPMLTDIIRQGVQEGVFTTSYPEQASDVIVHIFQGMSYTIIDLLMSAESTPDDPSIVGAAVAYTDAVTDAMERVLGAPRGSFQLIDPETLRAWFARPEATPITPSEMLAGQLASQLP